MFSQLTTHDSTFGYMVVECWPAKKLDSGKWKQDFKLRDDAGHERNVSSFLAGPDQAVTPDLVKGQYLSFTVRRSSKKNQYGKPYYNGYLTGDVPAKSSKQTFTKEAKEKDYEREQRLKAEGMTRTHICGSALEGAKGTLEENLNALNEIITDPTRVHLIDTPVSYCMDGFPVPDPSIQEDDIPF